MPELKTLPEDILGLFDPNVTHEPNEENLDWIADNLKDILRTRLKEREKVDNPLRFSSLGRPDRQIWYTANSKGGKEDLNAKTYFKFLYGDVIELLVLFLAKESGHKVERLQEEIEVDGVLGHIDAVIDDVVVDVKSASPYGYKKFKENAVLDDDPFGYVQQLAGYSTVLNPGGHAAWVAFDKVHGDICVSNLSSSIIADHDPAKRIAELKEVIDQAEPPKRCYPDKPEGKSGNRVLAIGCSYCPFKNECWNGLRTFLYSNGPKHFTHVEVEPKVYEVKNDREPDAEVQE